MNQDQNEKRVALRALLGAKVKWTIDNQEWFEDGSKDVSSSGIMLLTTRQLEPGSRVTMTFKLPNLKFIEPIIVESEVARIIKRQNKQVGIGFKFLTLRSNNYVVLQEFVCRISGIQPDNALKEIGNGDGVSYSFTMERLAREAERAKIKTFEKKLAKTEEKIRLAASKKWKARLIKIGGLLLGSYVVFKVYGYTMNLLSLVKKGSM